MDVAKMTCEQSYLDDLKKVVQNIFELKNSETIQFEILEIPPTYTQDKKICEWSCNAALNDKWELKLPAGLRSKPEGETVKLMISVTEPDAIYSKARGTIEWPKEWTGDLKGNALQSVSAENFGVYPLLSDETLKFCLKKNNNKEAFLQKCLRHKEARVEMIQLNSGFSCEQSCAKAVCQFVDPARYQEDQDPLRCFKEGICGGDGVCSLPGRRAGHASASFSFNGGPSVLLLYGGEIYESGLSDARKLAGDVVTGWFDGQSLTWARLNLDCQHSFSCPVARRDMSISIIDSRGGSSGKLIMFGGFAGGLHEDFLEGSASTFRSLNDLWYMDLDQLDLVGGGHECLSLGKCLVPMKWVQIDVPGDRPMSRFGASMSILDSEGQGILYLTGGVNKMEKSDTSSLLTAELDDLHLFRLRDPFYRRCSATGVPRFEC